MLHHIRMVEMAIPSTKRLSPPRDGSVENLVVVRVAQDDGGSQGRFIQIRDAFDRLAETIQAFGGHMAAITKVGSRQNISNFDKNMTRED